MKKIIQMDYNTSRQRLILPEYGRNIHQMIEQLKLIKDKEERNQQAKAVIDVMSAISPQFKNKEEMAIHLWTQLMIMAEFDLDVEIPVEIPEKEKIFNKPDTLEYPKNLIRIKHYGRNVELLISAIDLFSGEEQELYVEQILNQMKKLYIMWNKDLVNDDIIIKDFKRLSNRDFPFLDKIELVDVKAQKLKKKKKKK
ncbi:MAG: DUF4290 domain-containing protein [Bacteroidales bacterium]|nr:DUF4290 domain-containing protein [Bacteroidales bacterium]